MRAVHVPRDDTTRSMGLDTTQYFTPHHQEAWSHGLRAVMRYIRRDPVVLDTPDLESGDWLISYSHQEHDELMGLGWDVGLVQMGSRRAPPTSAHFRAVGEAAGQNARAIGIPAGGIVVCDCEWANPPPTAQIITCLEEWVSGCVRASDGLAAPWLYVTPDLTSLGPAGLYRLPFRGYWYSATWHCGVAVRGPGIVQTGPFVMGGGLMRPVGIRSTPGPGELLCDLDRFGWDHRGGRPLLMAA